MVYGVCRKKEVVAVKCTLSCGEAACFQDVARSMEGKVTRSEVRKVSIPLNLTLPSKATYELPD